MFPVPVCVFVYLIHKTIHVICAILGGMLQVELIQASVLQYAVYKNDCTARILREIFPGQRSKSNLQQGTGLIAASEYRLNFISFSLLHINIA